ncbi:MAG: hypothetical protein A3G37_03460 [Omnitrophica WOR_2 bacterium RIFCSPLOWO2_12_FULL_46_30]|nr:MAG: hypothetical protein A3D27_02025 [Omnitrophica WOR_2 bacterium RIFCSPHIGHO2_02_FULL_46_37]OGX44604.1 MAG: hypothetical protein A3H41_01155 [Omnitrophica WOR_2 bacterium RIFCSPLOWO2_02_FULL_45_28]OGX52301.1 MAG: hypothetical protein A3G37_03460 [Omnitrophica WOR_2 bacterium RIFCSPLOWO2_12_FULL_46_30]
MSTHTLSKGFTLLEFMLALIIFSAGVIAIVQAFNAGFLSSEDASNVDLALNIAQAKMEEIKNTAFSSLADSGPVPDTNFSNFNLTVNVAEGQNPMRVDVTVNWNVKGGQVDLALTGLVTNY